MCSSGATCLSSDVYFIPRHSLTIKQEKNTITQTWTTFLTEFLSRFTFILEYSLSKSRHTKGRNQIPIITINIKTACAISDNHHYRCEFGSNSLRDVLDTTLCDKVFQ